MRTAARPALAVLAVVLAPWLLRCLSLAEEGLAPGPADLRGFVADLGVACLLVAVLWLAARLGRWLAAALAALLAFGFYVNFETISALGSLASLADAHFLGDRTFLLGSALAVAHPWLLGGLVLAAGLLASAGFAGLSGRAAVRCLALGVVITGPLVLLPADAEVMAWRQTNVLAYNAGRGLARPEPLGSGGWPDPPAAMLDLLPELRADLSGEPRFALDGHGRNVLLVVLEGVSGGYLPTVAREHGQTVMRPMPRLDEMLRRNVGYTSFFSHQRRTNRGLYALLCGELPRLDAGVPKMTAAVDRPWQRCLPEVLRDAGYHTVYLQSAPLAFMLKDRFMPRAGFTEVLGHDWFESTPTRTKWGVDDETFFREATKLVTRLEERDRPWFLTLMTVGTHHPYTVPVKRGMSDATVAFDYLDRAVSGFLGRLERLGVRDDTLILVVSDESAGAKGRGDDGLSRRLAQNWSFAVALLPERTLARVSDPYAQMDVALSVLDYLGLGDRGGHFFGRSLFRRYEGGRYLFFGNVNFGDIGGLAPDGRMVWCGYSGDRCEVLDASDGRFFASDLPRLPEDPELAGLVKEMALRSGSGGEAPLGIPLVVDPRVTVTPGDGRILHGGQLISLTPADWLEVDLELEAHGPGTAELWHRLRVGRKTPVFDGRARLQDGQRLRVKYTFAVDEGVSQVDCRSELKLLSGPSLDLEFSRRRFVVHRSGARPPRGVQLAAFDLEPRLGGAEELRTELAPPESYEGVHGYGRDTVPLPDDAERATR